MASAGSKNGWRGKAGLAALLFLCLALSWHGNARVGLFESSEARYAEAAREMLATGDFLSPQVNFIYHFTKPPMAYWITAGGYALFGQNPFGARFFLGIAAALTLLLTALLYRRESPGSGGLWAGLFLLLSLEFIALAKVLTTDMYLTLAVAAGFFLWDLREGGRLSPRAFCLTFGILAAATFLLKGPVAPLFWAVVIVPYSLWKDRGRSLRPFASPLCWGTFLLLALPWFVAVGMRHPGLMTYLITRESAEAAISAKRFHAGPWYYFALVLLAGFFPWWGLVFARAREAFSPRVRLWLLWAVVPILVWSLFPAKLPTYILPSFPAWALLAAWALERGGAPGRALAVALPGGVGLLAGAALAYLASNPKGWPPAGRVSLSLLALSALVGGLGMLAGGLGRGKVALAVAAAAMILIQVSIPFLCMDLEEVLKIESGIGRVLESRRAPGEPVLEHRITLYSIPFYIRGKVYAYDSGFASRKYVERIPPHLLRSDAALDAFLKEHAALWAVTEREEEADLQEWVPGIRLVFRGGRHSLWYRPGPAPPRASQSSP